MFSKLTLIPFLLAFALAICVDAQAIARKVPRRNSSTSQNAAHHPHHTHHPHHPRGARQPAPPPSFYPRTPPRPSPALKPPPLPSSPASKPVPPPPSPASEPPPLKSDDTSVGVNGNVPEIQDLLDAHNVVRRGLGLGLLIWDERLAIYARQYAQRRSGDCSIVHSGGPYGENLAWSSGELSAISAVQMWVVEAIFYNYATNMCLTGEECGHYTQVVWRDTARIGCGKVACGNGGGTFLVCSYDPPGNYVGQRPY